MFERSRPLIGGSGFLSSLSPYDEDTSWRKRSAVNHAEFGGFEGAVSMEQEEEEVIMLYEWADNHSHQPRRCHLRLPLHVLPRR